MARGDRSGTATWHDETDERLVTLEIDFTQSRYYPATWNDPAEGGEVELGDMEVSDFQEYNEDGDITRVFADLTSEEKAAIVVEYRQKFETDSKVLDSVYEACSEVECYDGRDY